MLKKHAKNTFIYAFSSVAMFIVVFFIVALQPIATVHAIVPDSYYKALQQKDGTDADSDWYFSSDYLDLSSTKTLIDGWQTSSLYDFSTLESNPIIIAVIDSGCDVYDEMFTGVYDAQGISADYGSSLSPYDVLLRTSSGVSLAKNVAASTNGDASYDLSDKVVDSHGTHVCGIIAMLIHYFNLEKYVKILPIKAARVGSDKDTRPGHAYFNLNDIVGTNGALDYALKQGANVINMSLGTTASSLTSSAGWNNSAFNTAAEKAVLVAAAGNGSTDCAASGVQKFYPAAMSSVLGVMNYCQSGTSASLYSSSNYGLAYDICAPGTSILSTVSDNYTKTNYNGYGAMSGTSMASPMVSFAAAVLQMKYKALKSTEAFTAPEYTSMMRSYSCGTVLKYSVASERTYQLPKLDLESLFATNFIAEGGGEVVVKPFSISVSFDNVLDSRQNLSAVHPVVLNANLEPSDYVSSTSISWYYSYGTSLDETYLGDGDSITFTPPTVAGTYSVKARCVDASANVIESSKTVMINYEKIDVQNAMIIANGTSFVTDDYEFLTGNTYNLTLQGVEYVNPDTTVIKWYWNDALVATGLSYDFSTDQAGEGSLTVTVNGSRLANGANVSVLKSFKTATESWKIALMVLITFLLLCALGAIGFGLVRRSCRKEAASSDCRCVYKHIKSQPYVSAKSTQDDDKTDKLK